MIRNSSFFWASDDLLQDNEDENQNDTFHASGGHFRSSSDILSSRGKASPLESTQLISHQTGYGTTYNVNVDSPDFGSSGRRKLFELPSTKDNNVVHLQTNSRNDSPAARCTNTSSIRFQVVIWHIGKKLDHITSVS
jgi:hypothetical protein